MVCTDILWGSHATLLRFVLPKHKPLLDGIPMPVHGTVVGGIPVNGTAETKTSGLVGSFHVLGFAFPCRSCSSMSLQEQDVLPFCVFSVLQVCVLCGLQALHLKEWTLFTVLAAACTSLLPTL